MLPPGTKIGPRYVIERLLGQGGMSNLYIATDLKYGNAVRVIKEMTARYADPAEQKMAEQLFDREATLLATLNHPHIPKVFDKFIFQGKYYLSMEYVQGEDLGKLIQDRGTIEEKSAATWGAQMATVLYYLHRQNPPIVFRDVKPSNIMIQNDQVKLIDFGIARMFTSAKKGDTMRIGSPGYAPPEQYGGQTDPRSDIYALGVTLHHAVTGYDPTISQTPFIIPPARNLNPKVSPEMEALIVKATQLDSDKRYQNCLDMKRDLQVVMRAHGMQVGNSVPFSTLNPTPTPAGSAPVQAPPGPPPGATVPKLPPSQLPGATPGATAATGAAATPATAAAPAPAGTAAAPPAQPTKQPRKRRSLWPALLLLAGLGAGVAAFQAPAEWRQAATYQVQRLLAQLPLPTGSGPQLTDAEKVLLWGGSAAEAAEAMGAEVRAGKATPAQQLDYQNALAYASGREIVRLSVVAPSDRDLIATIVSWQRLSWEDAGRDGKLTVVTFEAVQDDWRGALRRALSSERYREGKRADGLLVFPPERRPVGWSAWFEGAPGIYWAGERSPEDPASAKTLELPQTDLAKLLTGLQLGTPLWLSKRLERPDSLKAVELDALLPLLKQNPKALVVADSDQLDGLATAPGVRVLLLAPGGALPTSPPAGPANLKLLALTQASPFSSDPAISGFFSSGASSSEASPSLDAQAYDRLAWAAAQLTGSTREAGLSWRSDRSGELRPARWTLLEARKGHWFWQRETGGER